MKIDIKQYIRNFFFCLRYPFYKWRNVWTGKFLGYRYTLYEDIGPGWRTAFGPQLSKDLKAALIKDKCLHKFRFTQIKEKYGTLRLYYGQGCGKNADKVLSYYERLSECYCQYCGKPSRYVTDGWITYLCEDCYDAEHNHDGHRLCYDDVPEYAQFDAATKSFKIIHSLIDYVTLWGLDPSERPLFEQKRKEEAAEEEANYTEYLITQNNATNTIQIKGEDLKNDQHNE